jgi:RNA polymerase sigma-70 factor (ECF subfamily)
LSDLDKNQVPGSPQKEVVDQAQLLRGMERGEEAAFRSLFDLYYQRLVTFAYRFTGDMDSARSVVQDVFVMLYDKRDTIRIHTSLKSHLFQSVRNRSLNLVKHEKMKREHHARMALELDEGVMPGDSLEVVELQMSIARVVDELPGQCQKIFRMSRQDGTPNQEIADKLSISKRTVETQISKALKRIREDLKRQGLMQWIVLLGLSGFSVIVELI